jgi:NADH:ubiquinone oxidoreductase subunit 6 (subunit J)
MDGALEKSISFLLFILVLKFQHFLHINMNTLCYKDTFVLEEIYIKAQYFLANDILNFSCLFTHSFVYLIIVGIILLLAMVGVLVLSINNNKYNDL